MKRIDYTGKVCPVCGKNEWELGQCKECGWQDDPFCEEYPDEDGGINFYSLNDCKILYEHFGNVWPSDEEMKGFNISEFDSRETKDGLYDWGKPKG